MDATEIGRNIAAGILVIVTTVQTLRAKTANATVETLKAKVEPNEELTRKEVEISAAHAKHAEEWKQMWENSHAESQAYRKYVHDKAKEDQALMASLSEENIRLKERTDLTPLVTHMDKVLKAVTDLTYAVNILLQQVKKSEV